MLRVGPFWACSAPAERQAWVCICLFVALEHSVEIILGSGQFTARQEAIRGSAELYFPVSHQQPGTSSGLQPATSLGLS